MQRRVIITENPLDASTWEVVDNVASVKHLLKVRFSSWPDSARVYHGSVAQENDITPYDHATIDRLDELEGDIYVIIYPEKFVLLAVFLVVAVVAAVILLKPAVPEVAAARNTQNSSPNNELSSRTNRERINARVPDIYGQLRSTPDLIAQTYNYYESNRKVEIAYMCVGRGEYAIQDVKDGDTNLSYIPGSSAAFYGPNTSPNSGHAPVYSVGSAIDDPIRRSFKIEQVVGQEMRPPNSASQTGANNIKFQYPDRIYNSVGINFQDKFVADDVVSVTGATYIGASGPVSVNAIARYVYNSGTPYVEWQSGAPNGNFIAGDSLVISNSTVNGVLDTFTTTYTGPATFTDTGRIHFGTHGSHPIEDGDDFRTGQSITVAGATFTYDFAATYTVASKSTSKLFLTTPALTNSAWDSINTSTGYQTMSIGGISRSARFNASDNSIELQSGNFSDITAPGTVVVSGSGAVFTTSLNGTYTLASVNNGGNYWTLTSPSSVNAEWNEINSETADVTVTITQVHAGDTHSVDFNGTYTVSSVTSTRLFLNSPASVNSNWSLLSGFVNDRTEYPGSTDTFYVGAPVRSVNLTGTYTIVSVGLYEIILSNPNAVSSDWNKLQFYSGTEVIPAAPTIATTGANFIGPYFLDNEDITYVYSSFIAAQGLYKDDGKNQTRAQVTVEMVFYPATSSGTPTGAPGQSIQTTLTGSAVQKDTIAQTMKVGLTTPGRQLMYARRVTPKDTAFDGTVVDTVKWEEVFMLAPETTTQFGNVTTVMTKTYATGGALALKERKLNCLVTRKIPYITGWTGVFPNYTPVYHADKQPTKNAAQIFCALSTDPVIGNRQITDIDGYGIFAALNSVVNYFGDDAVAEFCYTFDNTNISYEEVAQSIANAVYCVAYRQGSQIRWKPEIATGDPLLIFNHRNKLPESENRSVRFGAENDYDSIQLEWVNPDDDGIETFFIPEDQSGVSPKKVETVGIRNLTQATYHAWRSYYKMLYQNTQVEFETTQEAAILVQRDRVLIADNTRATTQDGEIWDQEVLQLTLSQDVKFTAGVNYTMFIQHRDGSVESIPVTSVADNLSVVKNVYILRAGGVRFPTPADAGLLSVGNVVALTATSYTDPVSGSLNLDGTYTVIAVDGSSGVVLFDNPGAVNADWSDITQTEHLRNGVNFNSSRDAKRLVNLSYAPRIALVLDPENYARPTYIIRGSTESAPAVFMITEVRPKDGYSYHITAANFDARFYYMDDLFFWMNFDDNTFRDASAKNHSPYISTAVGKAQITYDSVRKSRTFYNPTNASAAWIKCDDLIAGQGAYTKAFWIKQGAGFDSYFLSNANEQFRVNNTGRIIATHSGTGGHTTELGQFYRLHRTMFNRVPSIYGMNYYLKRTVANGIAATSVLLVALSEFVTATSGMSNTEFADYLYLNGLGRARDVGETSVPDALTAATMTRAQACVYVSESAEAITKWASALTALATQMNGSLTNVNWPSSDGNWHHACVTYSPNDITSQSLLRVYIDGVLKAQRVNTYLPYDGIALQPIGLGSSGVASTHADDIRYWRRAFTEQQVAELYNSTR